MSSSSTLVKLTRSQQIQVFLLILPIVLISAQGSERYRCPPGGLTSGWIYEYESKCYQFILEEKTWEDAKRFCYANNGALLNTDTQSKHNFVVGILMNELGNEFKRNGFWLGLHDKDREGEWLWDEGPGRPDTPMGWSFWQTGEPNNLVNQDCVYMRRGYSWRWVDVECTGGMGRTYSFGCEYDMLPPTTTTTKAATRTSTSASTTPRTTPITTATPVVTIARSTTKITTTLTRTTVQTTSLPTTTSSTTTLPTTTMKSTTPSTTTLSTTSSTTSSTTISTTTSALPSTEMPTTAIASIATVATTPSVTIISATTTTATTTTLITTTATTETPASSEVPATSTGLEATEVTLPTPTLKTTLTSTATLPTTNTSAKDLQTTSKTSTTNSPETTATFTVEEITTTGELTAPIKTTTALTTEQTSDQTLLLLIAESTPVKALENNPSKAGFTEADNATGTPTSIDDVSTSPFATTNDLHGHTTATVGSSPTDIVSSNTLLERFTHEEATPIKSTATVAKTSSYELPTSGYKHTLVEDRSKEALTTTESSVSAKSEIFIKETQKDVLFGKEADKATVEQKLDKESIKDDGSLLKISESGKIKADKEKSNDVYIYIGIASGVILILVVAVMVVLFVSRRKRTKLAETPTALTNPCFIDRESLAFDNTTDHWSGSGSFGVTFKISSQEAGKYPVGGTKNNDISFIGTSTQQERCYDESCMNDSAQDNLLPFISDSPLRMQLSFLTDSQ